MHIFNNSNAIMRIMYRWRPYFKLLNHMHNMGVPYKEMLLTRFPYVFKTNALPASLSIELSNFCNLSCAYCNIPTRKDKKAYMQEDVFRSIIERAEYEPLSRIRIGGGEPTLHPHFIEFSELLGNTSAYKSIVTNGQWKNIEVIKSMVQYYDLIEVSVDAGGKHMYEKSRKGASYELLIENIQKIAALKKSLKSKSMMNIRLMVRPSTKKDIDKEKRALLQYADSVMVQYIMSIPQSDESSDIYIPTQRLKNTFAKCTLPFKDLMLTLSGDAFICQVKANPDNYDKDCFLGNICDHSISQLWSHEKMCGIRAALRNYDKTSLDNTCEGCAGR